MSYRIAVAVHDLPVRDGTPHSRTISGLTPIRFVAIGVLGGAYSMETGWQLGRSERVY